ncbi:hypothetical protein [Gracilibacillus saliphilus]|uniref:hypothetical protein n=1 Tax=Gracilibacillus saliphilus TaxID=543890 RepID=UPI0013D59E8F|nr:hypothetical protein [Gracilibacillus saliphilus]
MLKTSVKTWNWLGFIFLLLSISSALLNISVFGSTYIVFYGLSVIGFIIGFTGWLLLKSQPVDSITRIAGNIGCFGNLAIVILFFLPFYFLWGTYIFGP